MNRQIEVNLVGGGSMHLSSSSIIYMKPNPTRGQFELAYLAGGKRIAKLNVTDTPESVGDAAEGLVTITNDMFSLINLDYVLDAVDHSTYVVITYQLPNNGRIIKLGKVTQTLSDIHSKSEKSPGKTARDATGTTIATNRTDIATNVASIEANNVSARAATRANSDGILAINTRLDNAGIR